MDIRRAIGKNIKKARIDVDMSQETLAAKVDSSYQHINKIENGNYTYLNVDLVYDISKALEVEFHTLFIL